MPRKKIVAGNWKMNKDVNETSALLNDLKRVVASTRIEAEIVVCPPFPSLERAASVLKGSAIRLGAQNMSEFDDGAYTGEVSARMLTAVGCSFVILGHSERRQYFHESDELINLKVKKALAAGLTPIICVGETLSEREGGSTEIRITSQMKGVLSGLTSADVLRSVIAYEPVWAIGTGKTATPEQADEVHRLIRRLVEASYDEKVPGNLRILYGGSVNAENAGLLFKMPEIDGGLIGGASLKPESFVKICLAADL